MKLERPYWKTYYYSPILMEGDYLDEEEYTLVKIIEAAYHTYNGK